MDRLLRAFEICKDNQLTVVFKDDSVYVSKVENVTYKADSFVGAITKFCDGEGIDF